MSIYDITPFDFSKTRSYPLTGRSSKVTFKNLASTHTPQSTFSTWLDRLPDILAARDLKRLAKLVVEARHLGRASIVGMGGHVIKCGLAPVIIDLIDQGFITAVAMNGSAAIHDFEMGLVGMTSEDVDFSLGKGDFGMAEETGSLINRAAKEASRDGIGFGEALGRLLVDIDPEFAAYSLLLQAYKRRVPVTIHLAIGTDIVHMHTSAEGGMLGTATHHDFKLFCSLVERLSGGGVYANFGSAVIMPEVFLKAVTVIRNVGLALEDFTTANFDFIQHYRPLTNVVKRPVAGVGQGMSFTGHHELMLPLFAAAIIETASRS